MNKDLWSNKDFTDIKNRLNNEIQRRGCFKWWDPLTNPSVGQDRTSPLSLPSSDKNRVQVDNETYMVGESYGSIERSKNYHYKKRGQIPAGQETTDANTVPNSSAAKMSYDEMRNILVGLSKIQDVDLFYGRDEEEFLAFRDPSGIERALVSAENSELNRPLKDSALSNKVIDPNGGMNDRKNPNPTNIEVEYPEENGEYVMPSGERDGEETEKVTGPDENNFFDDYGAEKGDSDFHPLNPYISKTFTRNGEEYGGIKSSSYGVNPRNPNPGNELNSRPVKGGVPTSCNVACTALCFTSCFSACDNSCTETCWNRCGNSCTSTCGNLCTGCSSMCHSSCKTKCENVTGYSCVRAGAKTVKIYSKGGTNGTYASNHLEAEYHTCQGCSYSCQFYPNKKTTCWDADCMGKCFTSCTSSCSTSCFGGCIDNESKNDGTYKGGKGRGCQSGCTINCVGTCDGVCEGMCTETCYHTCKGTCEDNCSYECSTNCGSGCANTCKDTCKDACRNKGASKTCDNNCSSKCSNDCNTNCLGIGCRAICGIGSQGACEANCRLSCMGSSCTSLCSDACSSTCTSCVNTCGGKCGICTSNCSSSCGAGCNITCTSTCEHSCETDCVHSCTETCGGCSNLCMSCVGMCIGQCSVKCENGCSSCANQCSWWCDTKCNIVCAGNCVDMCISTCSGSCATHVGSESTKANKPDRDPTSEGYKYPHPKNREEERESFKIYNSIQPYDKTTDADIKITFKTNGIATTLDVTVPDGTDYLIMSTTTTGGIFELDEESHKMFINEDLLSPDISGLDFELYGDVSYFAILTEAFSESIRIDLPIGFGYSIYSSGNSKYKLVIMIERYIGVDEPDDDEDDEYIPDEEEEDDDE